MNKRQKDKKSTDENGSEVYTRVETIYRESKCNYRLLFGKAERVIDQEFVYGKVTRKIHLFKPGDIFCLDLWDCNEFGTVRWAVYVLQAAAPGEIGQTVPQVKPGAKVLLEASGKRCAQEAVKMLAEIEKRTDPCLLPPSRFLLTDFRIKALASHGRPKWS